MGFRKFDRHEEVPEEEQLKKIPTASAKCLGCKNGFVWDHDRGRKIKCTTCKGSGYLER